MEDIIVSESENEIVFTSVDKIDEATNKILWSALKEYNPDKKIYGENFNDSSTGGDFTVDRIDSLSQNINSSLTNVLEANNLIRQMAVEDDSIGAAVSAIYSNINTDYRLSYKSFDGKRNKSKQLEDVKRLIDSFNRQINIRGLIRDAVTTTFMEGNRIYYLRNKDGNYQVSYYPLGVVEISDWNLGEYPVVVMNMTELKNRLRKSYAKDKKNKALFFENMQKEVEANFPPEVVEGYKRGDSTVRLNSDFTGVMRTLNFGRKYGVSPVFRALRSAAILRNIENRDVVNNKAKSKKIIHQILRKELLGGDGSRKGLAEAAHAHKELMSALKNQTSVYTSAPFVQEINYVEPKVDDVPTEKIALYRSRILASLGIAFTDSNLSNLSISKISLDQLLRQINAISEQLEHMLERWYEKLLRDNGYSLDFCPTVRVIDSEALEFNIKKDLAAFLYSTLNCSLGTALSCVGIDINDEAQKRKKENEDGISEIFYAHPSQYTNSGKESGGRPVSEDPQDPNKQEQDKERYENSV